MKAARRRPRASSSGYTLIEILVALTLLGFIVVLMSGTFRFGARAWEASSQEIDRIGQVEAVQSLLRRELAQAYPLFFDKVAAEPEPVFAGRTRELRFAAPLPIHHRSGGSYVFVLGVTGDGSSDDLVLGWRAYRPDAAAHDELTDEPVVLLREVADIRVAYFGRIRDEADPVWHAEWVGAEGLPDLIRVDVVFPEADRRIWPSFIVALKSKGSVRP